MKLISYLSILLFTTFAYANISPTALSGFTEIAGTTDNYVTKDKDGVVDFSLVVPSLTVDELMNFDLARIISPENDELNVLSKQIIIPSNLSLPLQKESYFFGFTLDKPQFRTYVPNVRVFDMYALQGTLPIKKVIDAAQGGQTIFEMVNLFSFKGGGSEIVEVKGPTKDVKISINKWTLDTTTALTVPSLEKDREILAFSLYKKDNEFYPADIKRVLSGQTAKLVNRKDFDGYILSVMVNSSQNRYIDAFNAANGIPVEHRSNHDGSRATFDLRQISYSIEKINGTNPVAATFLPQIPSPQWDSSTNALKFTAPQITINANPYLMLVTLSEINLGGSESLPLDVKKTLWVSEAMNWQSSITIPSSVTAFIQPGKEYAWEVLFLASAQPESDTLIDWSKVSHATRSTLILNP